MKLRTKTVAIFVVTTIILLGTVHTMSYSILLNSYGQLEQKEVTQQVERVQGALLNQYTALNAKVGDWAIWDDSYQFVQDNNSAFRETNLIPVFFVNFGLNFILYFNSSGNYVDGMGFNLVKNATMPVPHSLLTMITNNTQIWNFRDVNDKLTGVVLTQGGPILLASRPILKSSGEGPIRGALIFGQYLDQQYVESLSSTVHLPLNLTLFSSWQGLNTASAYTSTVPSIYVHPLSPSSVIGYDVLTDIYGKPALVLGATMPRDTYQQGLTALNYIDLSVGAACVLFSLTILALMEGVILSRLHKLASDVVNLVSQRGTSARLYLSGDDEIASLGGSINHMLEDIDKKTIQLRRSERLSAIGELATMVAHDLRNPLQGIANAAFYLKRSKDHTAKGKETEMLAFIEQDVNYSNKIVNDLLDYSRDLRLELTETNPQELMKQTLSTLAVPENIRVQDETEDKPRLKLDLDKTKRALANIITNSIDAMPRGGSLLVRTSESDHAVDFIIADSGVGMTGETLEKIFAPFYTTKAKGMGFGLSITKRIIEAHGGHISAESTLGKGTTFTFSLPLIPTPKEVRILE